MDKSHQHIVLHAAPAGIMTRSLQIFMKAELGELEFRQSYSLPDTLEKLIKNEPRLLIIDADLTDLDLLNPASISEFLKSVHEICLDLTVIILVNTIAEKKAVLETGEKHVFLKGVQEEQFLGVCSLINRDLDMEEGGKIYKTFRYDLNSL